MRSTDPDHLLIELQGLFPDGSRLGFGRDTDAAVVGVRRSSDGAALLVRFDRDSHLYGIAIPFETGHEFYYSTFTVTTDEEWLASVVLGVNVLLDTGFRASARREQVGDYIELREAGGWPDDPRFYYALGEAEPNDSRTIGSVTACENSRIGGLTVGRAVVSWKDDTTADLEEVRVGAGVPISVALGLAHLAAHVAAAAGATTVSTSLDLEVLSIAGFRPHPSGVLVVDTSFLDADPAAAARLLAATLATDGDWGLDRDAAGRPLPPSRVGRLWHRVRHRRDRLVGRTYAG